MKIDANVEIVSSLAKEIDKDNVTITIDLDYITPYESDIYDDIAYKLEEKFHRPFSHDDFDVTNLQEIVEEILNEERGYNTVG